MDTPGQWREFFCTLTSNSPDSPAEQRLRPQDGAVIASPRGRQDHASTVRTRGYGEGFGCARSDVGSGFATVCDGELKALPPPEYNGWRKEERLVNGGQGRS